MMLRIEEVLLSMRIVIDEADLGYVLGDGFDQRDVFGSHCRCLVSSQKGFPGDAECCNIRWKLSLHLPLMGGILCGHVPLL
jgi:hypothetical protein